MYDRWETVGRRLGEMVLLNQALVWAALSFLRAAIRLLRTQRCLSVLGLNQSPQWRFTNRGCGVGGGGGVGVGGGQGRTSHSMAPGIDVFWSAHQRWEMQAQGLASDRHLGLFALKNSGSSMLPGRRPNYPDGRGEVRTVQPICIG